MLEWAVEEKYFDEYVINISVLNFKKVFATASRLKSISVDTYPALNNVPSNDGR